MRNFCSYFNNGICKSCDLITLDYSDQIKEKEENLKRAFKNFTPPPFLPTVTSKERTFRNKAKLVVTGTTERPIIGLFGEDEFDLGRELTDCPLHFHEINEAIPIIRDFIKIAKIVPYQTSSRTGELKGIVIFYSDSTNESYLRFIMRSKESIDRIKKYQIFLTEKISHLKSISVNIQPVPHQIPEGEEEIYITVDKLIHHTSNGFQLFIHPRGFVQTNQEVARKLYMTASQWVKQSQLKNFLELFCGQGAFSFHVAPFIHQGLGIEINEEAVKIANESAQKNQLKHLRFKCADATKISDEIKDFSPDIILVNPPRRGLSDSLDLLMKQKPLRIIYSSCNIQTLSTDLEKIVPSYSIEKTQIFDMFPNSKHFETLVELKLKD
jgi:23S rRNA (uracil747-C5)-methyltransferase